LPALTNEPVKLAFIGYIQRVLPESSATWKQLPESGISETCRTSLPGHGIRTIRVTRTRFSVPLIPNTQNKGPGMKSVESYQLSAFRDQLLRSPRSGTDR
jgi:hypothetical protein